jgi:hypothetical protein
LISPEWLASLPSTPSLQVPLLSHQKSYDPHLLRRARELLENAVYRIEVNREEFFHRHLGTWLLLRSASRSALQLLGMAIKCRLEAEAGDLDRSEPETFFPDRSVDEGCQSGL